MAMPFQRLNKCRNEGLEEFATDAIGSLPNNDERLFHGLIVFWSPHGWLDEARWRLGDAGSIQTWQRQIEIAAAPNLKVGEAHVLRVAGASAVQTHLVLVDIAAEAECEGEVPQLLLPNAVLGLGHSGLDLRTVALG